MATVLVVDDSPLERHKVGSFLSRRAGLTAAEQTTGLVPSFAGDGREALAEMERQVPDVVVTDLRMPNMDGLEFVEAVKQRFPSVPVILMTAYGSEDLALYALQRGAAGYVPKRNLPRDLLDTVEGVLETARALRGQKRVMQCLQAAECAFTLENDPALIPALAGHLRDLLAEVGGCDQNELLRVSVALREALTNAMNHGNLEVSSGLLETSERAFLEMLALRRREPPYCDRHVRVTVRQSREHVTYVVRDEGPGFDPGRLPDPTDPANLERVSGRGLLLIRTFMDEVRHNATGNEITMTKRLRGA